MRFFKWLFISLIVLSFLQFYSPVKAIEEGGYVAREVNAAISQVWYFIKNFSYEQYYYAYPFEFTTSDSNYIDNMDIAFFCGHGNHWRVVTKSDCCDPVNFCSDPVHLGDVDLEVLTIYSCSVVPSPLDVGDKWDDCWWDVFRRLHLIVGFRTTAYASNTVSDNYADNMKAGYTYIDAWFNALNSVRSGNFPGYGAVMYVPSQNNYDGSADDTYSPYTWVDPPTYLSIIGQIYQY